MSIFGSWFGGPKNFKAKPAKKKLEKRNPKVIKPMEVMSDRELENMAKEIAEAKIASESVTRGGLAPTAPTPKTPRSAVVHPSSIRPAFTVKPTSVPEKAEDQRIGSISDAVLENEIRKNFEKLKVKSTIEVTSTREGFVNIHGIELPEAKDKSGAPSEDAFTDYVEHSFSIEMQRSIAKAWLLNEPWLYEGGSDIGKSKTIMRVAQRCGYEVYPLTFSFDTDKAELIGSPTLNPEFGMNGDQRKFIIVLSQIVKALTPEEGKIKVCTINEYNAAMPGVRKKINEIIDAYKGVQEYIYFPELGGIKVKLDREKVKLAASMNEPGGKYPGTNIVAPDDIRRWLYQKGPEDIPESDRAFAALVKAGLRENVRPDSKSVENREQKMKRSELAAIPGLEDILVHYFAFHDNMKILVEKRQIANGQPQRFTFSANADYDRVLSYISHFYNGDITETMQDALQYIYGGKILDPVDKKKVNELIRKVAYTPKANENRQSLSGTRSFEVTGKKVEKETVKSSEDDDLKPIPPSPDNLRKILKILGSRFYGPKDFSRDEKITLASFTTPNIPFSINEMKSWKTERLVLKIKKGRDFDVEWVKEN